MIKYILFVCSAFFAGSVTFAQSLGGQILDKSTNIGVPFCKISIDDLGISGISDSLGNFSFNNSLPDKVKLRVFAPGYETIFLDVTNNSADLLIYLESSHLDLEEITISGNKSQLQKHNAIHIESKKMSELQSIPTISLVESLTTIPGVYQSSTGSGISKPVIRGMQGMRVVTILNGLRIENQQWGGDHSLGIATVGLGAVELIKGPASLLYGADALGGVLYLIDESFVKQNSWDARIQSNFDVNTKGISNQFLFRLSKSNFRFNVAGGQNSNADYMVPNGKYVKNTRSTENVFKFAMGANRKNWTMNFRYAYTSTFVGIPGAHEEEEEDSLEHHDEEFYLDVQKRRIETPFQYFHSHFASMENKWMLKRNEISLLLGNTINKLQEFEESKDTSEMDMHLINFPYNLKWVLTLNQKWNLISGAQGMYYSNRNTVNAVEKLIPNSITSDNGIYSVLFFKGKKWNYLGGLRFDNRTIQMKESFNGIVARSFSYNGFNFSSGFVYSKDLYTVRLNASSGFRAPHLSELLANGEHHGAMRYEIGDVNLKPEKATQIDLTYEVHNKHFEFIINPFYNYLVDFINLQPTDSMIEDLQVFQYQQIKKVDLYGLDLGIHYHPHFAHWLHWESTFSYIRSERNDGSSLPLMPQNRINSLLKFSVKTKGKFYWEDLTVQHSFYAPQYRVTSDESESKAYNIINVNFQFGIKLKNPLLISIGAKNIFNQEYVDHLSRLKNMGIPNQGRNFFFQLKYTIN